MECISFYCALTRKKYNAGRKPTKKEKAEWAAAMTTPSKPKVAKQDTTQQDTDTVLTYYTKTNHYNVLTQHCTMLYPITNVLKLVRYAICISYDLKTAFPA